MSTNAGIISDDLDEVLPLLPEPEAASLKDLPDVEGAQPSRILTSVEGHDFYGTPAVQNKAALSEDGVLYLTEDALSDVFVRSYKAMLDRRRKLSEDRIIPYKEIRYVSHTEIQRLYAAAAGAEISASEITQRTAEQAQVAAMLGEAASEKASDIFIEVHEQSAEIQYRIAGDVERRFALEPERAKRLIRTIYDSMCEATSDPHYDPTRDQGGRIQRRYTQGFGLHQARVSTGPTDEERPFMAIRLHYDLGEPKRLVELGFTAEHEAAITGVTNYSSGIILFSGPTGSGKSTSLANLIGYRQKIDNCRTKIIALEDPPEIPIYGAIQKAVLRKGLDREAEGQAWLAGFETLMRWNPDWIIAGELRLRETMDAALKAALTNHLTWGMLHASSATLVPVRLQEAGIDIGYLCDPEIFRVFSNQSLIPQLCPHCSLPYSQASTRLDKEQRDRIEEHCTADTVRLRGPGCDHCYRGVLRERTVCAEVLVTDRRLLDTFRRKGALEFRKYWVRERGGKTKTQHMISKINAGRIDPTDAERIGMPLHSDETLWENG